MGTWVVDHMIFYDVEEIINWEADPAIGGMCDDMYGRMQTSDILEMLEKHPAKITFFVFVIAALLLLPQVASSMLKLDKTQSLLSHTTSFILVRETEKDTQPLEQQVASLSEELNKIREKLEG